MSWGGGDPRHSPVWEGQHRILSVQIENVGRVPVRDLQFDLLKADGEPPANEEEAAILKKHFQVLWHPGCRPSSLGPSGTVIYSEDALLQITGDAERGENSEGVRRGEGWHRTLRGNHGAKAVGAAGRESGYTEGGGGGVAKRRRKIDQLPPGRHDSGPRDRGTTTGGNQKTESALHGPAMPANDCNFSAPSCARDVTKTSGTGGRGTATNAREGLWRTGERRADDQKKKGGGGPLYDSEVLISPGQKVRMPLRCIASAECSSCIIR